MINCLVVDDEPLAREAIINYINRVPDLHLAGECENAIQAMQEVRLNKVDLIFLDIEMPEIDGISFLHSIKNIPGVILTTAYRDYAVDAFDLDVIDFLLKPISFDRFLKAINKFYQNLETLKPQSTASSKAKTINVKADRKTYKIELSKIQYFESLKDYVKIVCDDETIVTHENISNYDEVLQNDGFIRIHRSFLIAKNRVQSFDAETVYINAKELPISRTYKLGVLARLEE
ncbi:MAG: LytTR family DNA-binding domain-containing protein [Salinivirgaceae bacterium]|jgi:DNA-binding LytR/AlgR family response regulator|nr:LytTR family DNA-binding domain-containing protein [Salinivirgaceae bacterium]